jgi:hypothetical protein
MTMIDFQMTHQELAPWCGANGIYKVLNYDTQAARDILSWRQQEGTLESLDVGL